MQLPHKLANLVSKVHGMYLLSSIPRSTIAKLSNRQLLLLFLNQRNITTELEGITHTRKLLSTHPKSALTSLLEAFTAAPRVG